MATMRRLKLISHEGPITSVKYNRDGDMLFTASKTPPAMVWRTDNGMRVGSYDGEKAAISCLDVNHDTTRLITASAGSMIKLWDCETGTCLKTGIYSTLNSLLWDTWVLELILQVYSPWLGAYSPYIDWTMDKP